MLLAVLDKPRTLKHLVLRLQLGLWHTLTYPQSRLWPVHRIFHFSLAKTGYV